MRRSSRLLSRGDTTTEVDPNMTAGPEPASESHLHAAPPPRKRRKRDECPTQVKVKSRGKLRRLPDLPVELLYEVFQHVEPSALLQLSRSARSFRNLLMSRSARPIWQSSLASVEDLPPTPDTMNEPQYVDLVWGSGCPVCGTAFGGTFSWLARVRYCRKCVRQRFLPYGKVLHDKAYHLISKFGETHLATIMPYIDVEDKTGRMMRLFPLDIALKYNDEIRNDRHENRIHQWVQEKEKAFMLVRQHARLGEKWDAPRRSDKQNDLERRRDLRQAAIEKRLGELGWADEIDKLPLGALGGQKSVRTVAHLSNRDWVNMRDDLVSFMQQQRVKRLADEKASALKVRRNVLAGVYPTFRRSKPFRAILPGVTDLESAPTVARLIHETPFDEEILAPTVLAALAEIPPSFFAEWRARCERELVARMQERLVESPALRAALDMDTFAPESLRLAILALRAPGLDDLHYPRMFLTPYSQDYHHRPWDARDVYPDVEMIPLARRAVELVERDPRTTTVEDMDRLDPWYHFPQSASDGKRQVFPWRILPRPWTLPRDAQLELLGPEDTTIARDRLRTEYYYMSFFHDDAQCVHCAERFVTSHAMEDHMGTKHGIERTTRQDFHAGMYERTIRPLTLVVKDGVTSAS